MHVEAAVIEKRIAETTGIGDRKKCSLAEFDQYKQFYLDAKGLMRALRPHLALEDKTEFERFWGLIKDPLLGDAQDLESVEELTEFLLQALKNANLSELGKKSHIEQIVDEIDISNI